MASTCAARSQAPGPQALRHCGYARWRTSLVMLMNLPERLLHQGPWISAPPLHNPCSVQFPTDPTPSPSRRKPAGSTAGTCASWAYLTSLRPFLDIFAVSPLLQPTKQLHDIHLQEPLTQLDFGRPFFHNKRIQAPSFSPVFNSTVQTKTTPFRNEILNPPKPSR